MNQALTPTHAAHHRSADYFSLEAQTRKGYILLFVVLAMVFGWGGLALISGAVIAPGRISVESSLKRVQHREGGIVSDILVAEGDRVQAGQVLVRLDSTVANANESIVSGQVWQFGARKMRLEAERDRKGLEALTVDPSSPAEYQKIVAAERQLMASRAQLRQQQKGQLNEQVIQANHEIEGLQAQVEAQARQATLIRQELVGIRSLYEKGYAPFTRVSELEREAERLDGQKGELIASIARARAQASQIRVAITQVDSQFLSEVMNDLKDTETKFQQLREQEITTNDALKRVEIVAPVTGKVQQLQIHTRGGVVSPGETLMLIVPEEDSLIVEARIDPSKIDDVQIGSRAFVRFTAFDTRLSPEVMGRVDRLSSDVETDEKSGVSYYRARLKLDGLHVPDAMRRKLVAGMPVEVHIETGTRNALSYFIKPLTDQMHRTFKEN